MARGPARLAQALGVDKALDGVALGDAVRVRPGRATSAVRTGPRVGVSGPGGDGTAYPLRFWLDGEPTVSAYRPGVVRNRVAP
nr:DNA-3-methyladenine glycosylase [Angustibacter aerolatus]